MKARRRRFVLLAVLMLTVPVGVVGLRTLDDGDPSVREAGRKSGHATAVAGASAAEGHENPFEEAVREEKAPEDFYLFQRLFTGGAVSLRTLDVAWEQSRQLQRQTRTSTPQVAGARWRFVGPTNIGARVVDIVVDPHREDTIYTASASGGVWKSTDAGRTFSSIWGDTRTQSMGALTMAGDGTLYAGTGETNPGGGSLTYGGDGVYKSTDRGRSWRHVGLPGSGRIGRIAVDPDDPDHVYAAVAGHLFTPGGQRGLYESTDAGRTWTRILQPANPTTGAVDIQVDPADPDNIYVAMWDHLRHPDRRDYAGPGSGIYRSSDGGQTFQRLGTANGLPAAADNVGRIGIGLDPSDPDRLYAIYINDLGSFQGFYVSDDGGDTWAEPPAAAATLAHSQSVYGWWFGRIWVDPRDSDHVFVAGLPLMESFDGGQTFPVTQLEQHVDHHAMVWDPHQPGRVYNGNDGGVYRSEQNGDDGSWVHGRYQPWSQFFTIDVSAQDPSRINGGLQDQGSVRSWGGDDWNRYNGGDGVKNVINPADGNNVFACSQYGSCVRSDDGGDNVQDMSKVSTRDGWLTPIEFSPTNPDVMYWAGNVVNRSTDRGRTWFPTSPDLGQGETGGETNPLYANHYGTVQAIGLTRADPRTLYAGTDNGYLWKSEDRARSWTEVIDSRLPDRWVTHVEVSDTNPAHAYVTYSGYRQGDHTPYVLRTRDDGRTWTDISQGLPQAPVNDAVLVDGALYVASDVGVFARPAGRSTWLRVGSALPRSPVNDLRYVRKNDTLYAGTFGRGIYAITPPLRP